MLGGAGGIVVGLVFDFAFMYYGRLTTVIPPLIILLTALMVGAALGAVLAHFLDFGVSDKMLARFSKWMVRDETLVVAQAPPRDMPRILDIMLSVEGSPPITFTFHPDSKLRVGTEEEIVRREPLTTERLSLEAGRLAASLHQVSAPRAKGRP